MAQYVTRVELHDAKWPEDYDKLHTEMAKEGFSKTVQGNSGKVYKLPTAEYFKISTSDVNEVLNSAKSAAQKIKPKYSVLVSQADHITFYGLDAVLI